MATAAGHDGGERERERETRSRMEIVRLRERGKEGA